MNINSMPNFSLNISSCGGFNTIANMGSMFSSPLSGGISDLLSLSGEGASKTSSMMNPSLLSMLNPSMSSLGLDNGMGMVPGFGGMMQPQGTMFGGNANQTQMMQMMKMMMQMMMMMMQMMMGNQEQNQSLPYDTSGFPSCGSGGASPAGNTGCCGGASPSGNTGCCGGTGDTAGDCGGASPAGNTGCCGGTGDTAGDCGGTGETAGDCGSSEKAAAEDLTYLEKFENFVDAVQEKTPGVVDLGLELLSAPGKMAAAQADAVESILGDFAEARNENKNGEQTELVKPGEDATALEKVDYQVDQARANCDSEVGDTLINVAGGIAKVGASAYDAISSTVEGIGDAVKEGWDSLFGGDDEKSSSSSSSASDSSSSSSSSSSASDSSSSSSSSSSASAV